MKKGVIILLVIVGVIIISGAILVTTAVKNSKEEFVTHIYEVEDFNNLNIDLRTSYLEIFKTSEDKPKVECIESEKIYHTVNVEDDTLFIKSFDSKKWYEYLFSFGLTKREVKVYLPNTMYDSVIINASTGNVIVNNEFTFNQLNIHVSTGNIESKAKVTGEAEVVATTGKITLESDCYNLHVKATTGKVDITNSNIENNLEIEVSTGKVNLENCLSNSLNITATTGDVNITSSDAHTITIDTSTGDVTASFRTNKLFSVTSRTGDIDLPASSGSDTCNIHTTTGDIEVTIE